MKTSNYIVFILLAVLAAACSKDDLVPDCPPPTDDVNGLIEMTFTAAAPETRTMLGEGSGGKYPVLWTSGDAIAVVPIFGSYEASDIAKMKFTTSIEEGETAASATFTGRTYAGDNGYLAFYPHGRFIEYFGSDNNYIITFTLPTEQTAVAGNFEPNLCPAWATTEEGGDLTFFSLCGLVKFRLSGDAVAELASVRFEAAGQPLTGKLGCNACFGQYNNNTAPISHVTLKGHFKEEVDYYMVVAPCYLGGGFSFTFTKEDGSVYVKKGKIEGSIPMGEIGNFGNIDLSDDNFTEPPETDITDMDFIKAVESSTGIALERNDAGYVPLTEGNLELMASVKNLDISNKALTDASALKYFTGLQTLDCSENKLRALDVSSLTKLTSLTCAYNQLKELDVSGLKNLTGLSCYDNQLMALTVTGATALERLSCYTNQLTELDVSGLTNLTSLYCNSNKLTTLTVNGATALETLYCYTNQLTTLDVSGLTSLTLLECYDNQLTKLEVGSLTNLTSLACNNNQLTTLDVSALTELTALICFGNRLTTLDISALRQLMYIFCGKQTSDGTTPQTLTLTLTAAQRDGVWESSLEYNSEYNEPVDLNVQQ